MAWTNPPTFNNGNLLTAEALNTYLRDNMMETEVAKAQTAGAYLVVTGQNEIAERSWDTDFILAQESTLSTTYVDLATPGPQVTIETGTRAIVFLAASIRSTPQLARMSIEISGATNLAPTVDYALNFQSPGFSGVDFQTANYVVFQGLTPGINTFTCKYLVTAGAGVFSRRRIVVLPF